MFYNHYKMQRKPKKISMQLFDNKKNSSNIKDHLESKTAFK